jgi:hypothetical protein
MNAQTGGKTTRNQSNREASGTSAPRRPLSVQEMYEQNDYNLGAKTATVSWQTVVKESHVRRYKRTYYLLGGFTARTDVTVTVSISPTLSIVRTENEVQSPAIIGVVTKMESITTIRNTKHVSVFDRVMGVEPFPLSIPWDCADENGLQKAISVITSAFKDALYDDEDKTDIVNDITYKCNEDLLHLWRNPFYVPAISVKVTQFPSGARTF